MLPTAHWVDILESVIELQVEFFSMGKVQARKRTWDAGQNPANVAKGQCNFVQYEDKRGFLRSIDISSDCIAEIFI